MTRIREENLQKSQTEHHDQQDPLTDGQLQRVDKWYRQEENDKVGRDVDSSRNVPDGQAIEAVWRETRNKGAHGAACE